MPAPTKGQRISGAAASEAGLPGPDPFTRVYQAVWSAMRRNPTFDALVPSANQHRYDGPRDPDTQNVQDTDTPLVRVRPSGGAWAVESSDEIGVVQSLSIEVEAIASDPTRFYFPLKWALVQIFGDLTDQTLGLDFVYNVTIADIDEDRQTIADTTTVGWYHLMDLDVEMRFDRTGLTIGSTR